jgi:hypothetical protein
MTVRQEVEVAITLNKRDAYRAGMLVFRQTYKWQYRLAFVASVLFCLFFLALHFGAPAERRWEISSFDVALIPPIVVYFFPHLVIGSTARAIFRVNPRAKETTRYVFSRDGIVAESPVGRADLNWKMYVKVRETREYFLLYPSLKSANPFPKRCFTSLDDLAAFREILRESIAGPVDLES